MSRRDGAGRQAEFDRGGQRALANLALYDRLTEGLQKPCNVLPQDTDSTRCLQPARGKRQMLFAQKFRTRRIRK
jgi:hypothetical protein